jgi:hypothetical protein
MIPHLIDDLGLDVYEYRVYGAIKRAAGEKGECKKSILTLHKETKIGTTKIKETISNLCKVNPIIKKPLLTKKNRLSEHGDKDTNIVFVNDIWMDNSNIIKKQSGRSHGDRPRSHGDGGVGRMATEGRSHGDHKEDHLKKTTFKKTTTTSSSNVHKSSSSSFSEENKRAAESLKAWMDNQATIPRKRKMGNYQDEVIWGKSWIIPLKTFENLIHEHGMQYFQDQLEYMVTKQNQLDSGQRKTGIDIPETYLKKACSENYAGSNYTKETL